MKDRNLTQFKKIDMKIYPKKFDPLFQYARDGLMRTEEFTPEYLKFGFDESDVDLLIELVFDEELNILADNKENEGKLFAPIHAIMVLAQLKTKKPFNLLLKELENKYEDDYYGNALLYYFTKVGAEFFDDLKEYFLNRKNNIYNRMLIFEALEKIIKKQSDEKLDRSFEEAILTYLKRDNEFDDGLNAFAIFTLIDISKATHIDLIRKVYETKPVDVWYDGDLEEIEIRLGLRVKRETPNPQNIFGIPFGEFDEDDMIASQKFTPKIGRNDPCPCGSGKKYKKCCK